MAEAKKMVELEKKEFKKTDDGKGLVMNVPLMLQKTYNKEGLLSKKAQLEAELVEVNSLLGQCDSLGVA